MAVDSATEPRHGTDKCPDCGGVVSIHAKACPHCGCPLGSPDVTHREPNGGVQTIERTSKKYKATAVVCFLLIAFGIVACFFGSGGVALGALMIVVGIVGAIVNRIAIWWNNG